MRAAIYARFSSERQNAASCADQVAALRPWVEAQGWTVAGVYQDEAVSGRELERRSGWQSLLRAAEQRPRPFDVVVVEDFDRWARDFFGFLDAARRLFVVGVRLATPARGIVDLEDTGDQIRLAVDASLSAEVSRKISVHTRRGQDARIGVVSKAGGPAPFGYRRAVKRSEAGDPVAVSLEIDERAAAVVREVFRLRVEDGLGWRAIASELHSRGERSPTGRVWSHASIRALVTNRRYTGAEVVGAWQVSRDPATGRKSKRRDAQAATRIVEGFFPAIVDVATWQAAQPTGGRRRTRGRSGSPLAGLIRCGICGRSVIRYGSKRADGGRYLRCSSINTAAPCGLPTVVESDLLARIRRWLASDDEGAIAALERIAVEATGQRSGLDEELRAIAGRLAELDQVEERLVEAVALGGGVEALSRRLRDVEAQRVQIEARREELEARLGATPDPGAIRRTIRAKSVEEWTTPAGLRRLVAEIIAGEDGSVEVRTTVSTVLALAVSARENRKCPGAVVSVSHGLREELVGLVRIA